MRWLLLVCALVSAGLMSGPADARSRDRQKQTEAQEKREERKDEWRDHRRDNRDRTAEAARRAQLRNGGGRVLSVEPEGRGHRVKVLKDGEVRVHHVDPD
ncbi:MAG: hypothetical protein ACRETF_01005 [Nevskiaceae bacterium]